MTTPTTGKKNAASLEAASPDVLPNGSSEKVQREPQNSKVRVQIVTFEGDDVSTEALTELIRGLVDSGALT